MFRSMVWLHDTATLTKSRLLIILKRKTVIHVTVNSSSRTRYYQLNELESVSTFVAQLLCPLGTSGLLKAHLRRARQPT